MKAKSNINYVVSVFVSSVEELETLLRRPNTVWPYKYINGSGGYLNICADANGRFHVGWGLNPRQDDEDWTWIIKHPYDTDDFNSLVEAIEYAEKY